MTKARARERAKARAAQKTQKRVTNADQPDQPDQTVRPGQFDPRGQSASSPKANAGGKNAAGAKRGSARSR